MIETIALSTLSLMLIPLSLVFIIQIIWGIPRRYDTLYATVRMVIQLLLIAYLLKAIFEGKNVLITVAILLIMLLAASWIAIRPLQNKATFASALIAVTIGACINLSFMFFVLKPEPWYNPILLIPIAGMVFSAAMNSVSLAAERFESVYIKTPNYITARSEGFNAALIPQINASLAVGLVSLPGMMTGQILSGVEPLIAVRYQIMIMCMALSVAGISAAVYLQLIKNLATDTNE